MVEGVAVVWMPVEDIERAKGFYRDALGLTIQNEDGPWAEVDANGLTIGLNLLRYLIRSAPFFTSLRCSSTYSLPCEGCAGLISVISSSTPNPVGTGPSLEPFLALPRMSNRTIPRFNWPPGTQL